MRSIASWRKSPKSDLLVIHNPAGLIAASREPNVELIYGTIKVLSYRRRRRRVPRDGVRDGVEGGAHNKTYRGGE